MSLNELTEEQRDALKFFEISGKWYYLAPERLKTLIKEFIAADPHKTQHQMALGVEGKKVAKLLRLFIGAPKAPNLC